MQWESEKTLWLVSSGTWLNQFLIHNKLHFLTPVHKMQPQKPMTPSDVTFCSILVNKVVVFSDALPNRVQHFWMKRMSIAFYFFFAYM